MLFIVGNSFPGLDYILVIYPPSLFFGTISWYPKDHIFNVYQLSYCYCQWYFVADMKKYVVDIYNKLCIWLHKSNHFINKFFQNFMEIYPTCNIQLSFSVLICAGGLIIPWGTNKGNRSCESLALEPSWRTWFGEYKVLFLAWTK